MHHFSRTIVAIGLLSIGITAANAQGLLISPTGGTSLSFTDSDDGSTQRSLGGTYSVYGSNVTQLFVQVNGFLSVANGAGFLADRNITTLASATATPVIAPLYDDMRLTGTNSIRENVGSTYYAATYDINGYLSTVAGNNSIFQAALFNAPTTLRGNTFLAGDIVFSYDKLNHTNDGTVTVGVAQNGTNGTGAFGGGGDFSTLSAFSSNFNPATQAILFRYNAGNNTYTQSLVTYSTVPAPSGLAVLGVPGLLGIGVMFRRRNRK